MPIIMLIYSISQFHTPLENAEDIRVPMMYLTVLELPPPIKNIIIIW